MQKQKIIRRLYLYTSVGHAAQINETRKNLTPAKKEPPLIIGISMQLQNSGLKIRLNDKKHILHKYLTFFSMTVIIVWSSVAAYSI